MVSVQLKNGVLEHAEIEMCAYRIEPSEPGHIDLEPPELQLH